MKNAKSRSLLIWFLLFRHCVHDPFTTCKAGYKFCAWKNVFAQSIKSNLCIIRKTLTSSNHNVIHVIMIEENREFFILFQFCDICGRVKG